MKKQTKPDPWKAYWPPLKRWCREENRAGRDLAAEDILDEFLDKVEEEAYEIGEVLEKREFEAEKAAEEGQSAVVPAHAAEEGLVAAEAADVPVVPAEAADVPVVPGEAAKEGEGAAVPTEAAEEGVVAAEAAEAADGVPEVDAAPSYLKLEEMTNEKLIARRMLCLENEADYEGTEQKVHEG